MRSLKRNLLTGAIALAFSAPAAAQFTGACIFGDSLSDGGQYGGRYTTNPGLTAAEYVNQGFGLTTTPSFQGGGNDTLNQFTLYATGKISQAQMQAAVGQAALDLATAAGKLQAAGARYIVVQGMVNAGLAPEVTAFGAQVAAGVTSLSGLFNLTLGQAIAQGGLKVIPFNTFAFMNEIAANPAAYGFVNVTSPACTTPTGNTCTSSTLVAPNANLTYMFADGHHGATGVYLAFASLITSMITGPEQIATLPQAPFAVEDANFRALDGRMWSSLGAPRTQKKIEAWAAYDYSSSDLNAGTGNGSANTNTIAVGADTKLTDKLLFGGMFGYTENKGDFNGAGGGYKLRQPVGTAYVGYGEGPWYVGATLGAGGLDYSDINRTIPLGTALRTETGQTRGYEYTGRLLGGYWLKFQDVLHGPYARVTYTKSVVRAFSETGSDSTTLSYGAQDREQLLWSLGWQVAGNIGNIRPFARVTWEYDSMDQTPSVSASSVSLGGNYTIPGAKPDNSYALFNVGASADFGGVTGFITGSGTAGRDDGNYWAITVGLRMPI